MFAGLFQRRKSDSDSEDGKGGIEVSHQDVVLSQEEEKEEVALSRDIFSLLFVSRIISLGFLYSFCFYALQLGIHFLILYNLLRDAPENNPLKVPLSVEIDVIGAQFCALLVSVISQEDMLTSLNMIRVGYNRDVLVKFPAATRLKWALSNVFRFSEGILSVFVSFIFIVQSTEVLELFLNFAAMQFVSMLDNIGFQLAHDGYMFGSLQTDTRKIIKTVRLNRREKLRFLKTKITFPAAWIIRTIFVLTTAGLYVVWFMIRTQQANGYYLNQVCQTFNIEFGDRYYDFFVSQVCDTTTDDGCPWKNRTRPLHYGPFSDWYEAVKDDNGNLELQNGRPVYYQRDHEDGFGEGSPPGKFSYCDSENAWVFTVAGVTKGVTDGCDWLMRSPAAIDAYSLHEAPSTGWSIWTGILEHASTFEISCGECEADVDCNYHGRCNQKHCVCDEPWMGTKCETCAACTQLSQEFLTEYDGSENETSPFIQLEGSEVYGRPVYYKNETSAIRKSLLDFDLTVDIPPGTIEVLFYAGTRFYISSWTNFLSDPDRGMEDSDVDRLRDIFKDFHSTWHLDDNENRTITFYTEITNNPMPIEVKWNIVKDAPLAIVSGDVSGSPVRVDTINLNCAIEAEKTLCSFQQESKGV